jgi:hypothetical protein
MTWKQIIIVFGAAVLVTIALTVAVVVLPTYEGSALRVTTQQNQEILKQDRAWRKEVRDRDERLHEMSMAERLKAKEMYLSKIKDIEGKLDELLRRTAPPKGAK